ncbi:hypothetical protein [Saliniramus fredricksonii]|uniref:hypothetical protein n=1 Tax=Saliniramus fredricksonii TaxID=1653334 RepID=UPI001EEEAF23|nr:hypothetical protein [Saliniramus fredricksonii]
MIYLAHSVPEAFAERLAAKGAQVVRAGATYEESMAAAEKPRARRVIRFCRTVPGRATRNCPCG